VRVCLVVNPQSGHGATRRRLPAIQRAVARHAEVTVKTTLAAGDGQRCAREACDEGFDRVVAVGGDGTVHEVVNGLFDGTTPRRPEVVLGVIHGGTGGDFVKSLRVPADLDEAARLATTAEPRPVDLMSIHYVDHDGHDAHRLCVNVLGFGMNGEVVRLANRSSKRLGGRLTFAGATLRALASYRPPQVTVRSKGPDGDDEWTGPLTSAFFANGHYCGGGMWVGRGGALDDGWVEQTIVPDLPIARAILATPHLYRGTAGDVKGVSRRQVSEVVAEAADGSIVLVDLDGEQPGRLPLRMSVLPKAVLVAML